MNGRGLSRKSSMISSDVSFQTMNACTNLTDEDRERLRGLLLQGAQSAPAFQADADYFEKLRTKIRGREAI